MSYSKEIIKEIYRSLPDELKQVAATYETSIINDSIAKNNGLTTQQRLDMGDEVTMRLIGVTPAKKFTSNLESRLKIGADVAKKIASEIESQIVSSVPVNILDTQEEYIQSKLAKLKEITTSLEIPPEDLPIVVPHPSPKATEGKTGEVVHDVAKQPTTNNIQSTTKPALKIPNNLPTDNNVPVFEREAENMKQEVSEIPKPITTAHYEPGQDPYREPIE